MIAGDRCLVEWDAGELRPGWIVEAPAVVAREPTDLVAIALDGEWSPGGRQYLVLPEEVRLDTA